MEWYCTEKQLIVLSSMPLIVYIIDIPFLMGSPLTITLTNGLGFEGPPGI